MQMIIPFYAFNQRFCKRRRAVKTDSGLITLEYWVRDNDRRHTNAIVYLYRHADGFWSVMVNRTLGRKSYTFTGLSAADAADRLHRAVRQFGWP